MFGTGNIAQEFKIQFKASKMRFESQKERRQLARRTREEDLLIDLR